MKQALGIDIGATKIWAAVVAENGDILSDERVPTPRRDGKLLTGTVAALCKSLHARFPVEGVGVGVPGPADFRSGEVFRFTNLGIPGFNLRIELAKATGIPVFLDNDANLAALGESRFGAGKDFADFIMLTLGTGIGGGIIINDQIYRGVRGGAAELGHMSINYQGERGAHSGERTWGGACSCGSYGCLEKFASGEAIALRAKELAPRFPESPLADKTISSGNGISGKDVTEAARKGDSLALRVFADVANALGAGLANLINIFDPEAIVLGGGVTEAAGGLFLTEAEREAKRLAINANTLILKAKLGNSAGVLGAASLCLD